MYCNIHSFCLLGLEAIPICVEVDISSGLPCFVMVGSLGKEVQESKDRVLSALKNAGLSIPLARITVNISPAGIHKAGTAYDLPLAIGILSCMNLFPEATFENIAFLGELTLDGKIKAVRGILPIVQKAASLGYTDCIVPAENVVEGSVVPGIRVRGADNILQVMTYFLEKSEELLPAVSTDASSLLYENTDSVPYDFSQVRGQDQAKRAIVVAASGFHSLLMSGPPGAGKTMLAKRIPGILPPLTVQESLEITSIASIAGKLSAQESLITRRPFQSPHHTATLSSIVGGGRIPIPGSISLAHRSVLFLDEFPEFDRRIIDSLRQPLEDRSITLNRHEHSFCYPADFLLVAAMNPCPCGYYPDRNRCKCTHQAIRKYMGKISGPILDRIDLCIELQALSLEDMQGAPSSTSSAQMQEQVLQAREKQKMRYLGSSYRYNSELQGEDVALYCPLGEKENSLMKDIYQKLQLSARSYHRLLKVARTLADLDNSEQIKSAHLLEAAGMRPNFEYWGL